MSLLPVILALSIAAPQAAAQSPALVVSSFYWGSTEKKTYVHPVLGTMSEERWMRIRRDPNARRHPRYREIMSMKPSVLIQRESYALVRNGSEKTVKAVTWDFVFYEDVKRERETRRFQFRTKETLKPGEMKFLTTSVDESAPTSYSAVVIERVEYEDGTTWQRASAS